MEKYSSSESGFLTLSVFNYYVSLLNGGTIDLSTLRHHFYYNFENYPTGKDLNQSKYFIIEILRVYCFQFKENHQIDLFSKFVEVLAFKTYWGIEVNTTFDIAA